MDTVKFKTVLDGVATRMGLDPGELLPESEARALTDYINQWSEDAWDVYPWPELVDLLGPVSPVDGKINRTTTLSGGDVLEVFRQEPQTYNRSRYVIPFRLRGNDVVVSPGISEVWIEVRQQFRRYTSEVYDPGASYAAGDRRYFIEDGEVKEFDGSSWHTLPFPDWIAQHVIQRAVAEARREVGDLQGAMAADDKAQQMLDRKIDKLELQQGQGRRYGVITPERGKGVRA